jgi:hypothetical protein
MEVVHVQPKEVGTPAKRRPSTTAGLTSGYQRTNITASGVSVAETTGGHLLSELLGLPCYEALPVIEPHEMLADSWALDDELARGYRSMAAENRLLAEDCLPIAREVWPAWEA